MRKISKKYRELIVEAIVQETELGKEKARQMLNKVDFDNFFGEVPEAAMKYEPSYWAELIINDEDGQAVLHK